MGEVAGYGGSVTFTAMQANARAWAITYECDELDITDFADAGTSDYIGGLTRWGGTIELHWDAANTMAVRSSASITLQATTGKTYTGTALFTREETSAPVEGLVSTIATFRGKGALTKPA